MKNEKHIVRVFDENGIVDVLTFDSDAKAKEYAEKYKELSNPALDDNRYVELVRALTKEMIDEEIELIKVRHIQRVSSLKSVERELNDKGNKISELLNYPLVPDWFIKLLNLAAEDRFDVERRIRNDD